MLPLHYSTLKSQSDYSHPTIWAALHHFAMQKRARDSVMLHTRDDSILSPLTTGLFNDGRQLPQHLPSFLVGLLEDQAALR